MLDKINHVAIAVADLDAAIAHYKSRYQVEPESREVIETDGVEEAMLRVGDSYVQLIAPTGSDSTVARYLERNGEGLHHIGYEVADVSEALAHLKAAGARLIDNEPRRGGGGALVAFVHPKDGLGTLIELVGAGTAHGA
ncbi:MAG: methylmalonyl-CoA epimerase [Acidobacteria bacterium]|nr:MAG: methylmalonyl-CoA epimerase [Acidobacteriota bacterium]